MWKHCMKTFTQINIKNWFTLKEKVPNSNRQEGNPFKRRKWSKEQFKSYEVNQRVIKLLVNVLLDEVLCHVGNYKDAKES